MREIFIVSTFLQKTVDVKMLPFPCEQVWSLALGPHDEIPSSVEEPKHLQVICCQDRNNFVRHRISCWSCLSLSLDQVQ